MQMDEHQVRQWVVDEHRDLLSMVRGVEAILESPAAPAPGDVARRIEDLAEHFASHAEQEERSPLYRDFPQAYPDHRQTLEALQRDHTKIVGELRELAKTVETAPAVGLETKLSTRVRAVVAEIRRHEASEASIVQELSA